MTTEEDSNSVTDAINHRYDIGTKEVDYESHTAREAEHAVSDKRRIRQLLQERGVRDLEPVMTSPPQVHRTRFAILTILLLCILASVVTYARHEWQARKRIQYQRLTERKQAVEEEIALSKQKQKEIIEKVITFRNETQSTTGVLPTNEEGPIPGYKKQIAELYEKIATGNEQLARIKKEMSQPSGQ